MTDRTLREKIASLPRYEPDDSMMNRTEDGMFSWPEGQWIKREAVLAILDAHTAAQPAPVDVSEAGPRCHQGVVALADESQQPAPDAVAEAPYICRTCRRTNPNWVLCNRPDCADGR